MTIRRITIRDFGAAAFYDTALTRSLNILDTRYTAEISAAIRILLCSKTQQTIPQAWLRPTTQLTAEVVSGPNPYTVTATYCSGGFSLAVTDSCGTDVTAAYQYLLSHCPEQDAADHFDGQDKSLPLRLCRYRCCEDAPEDLSARTGSLADTKTFRSHLRKYIKAFRPAPIHCEKAYQVSVDAQGRFGVFHPGVSGQVFLSETEEKLFLYVCFLNIAEFWTDMEKLRDLHHEKKPLVIENLLEFLDVSADIDALIARTVKLHRQIIILTPPLSEESKKKWIGV